jgi:hypothetical protein
VVIGAGTVALRKVQALAEAGGRVTVVAEHIQASIRDAFLSTHAEIIVSSYSKNYLVGATLCIAATNDPAVNQQVYNDCQELEVLCNVVDQPHLCDFFVPAVVKRVPANSRAPRQLRHTQPCEKKLEACSRNHANYLMSLKSCKNILIEVPNRPAKLSWGNFSDDLLPSSPMAESGTSIVSTDLQQQIKPSGEKYPAKDAILFSISVSGYFLSECPISPNSSWLDEM